MTAYKEVVGAVVAEVTAREVPTRDDPTGKQDEVRLLLGDSRTLVLLLEGDCCSHSYFTNTNQFNELIGSTIHAIEGRKDKETNDGEVCWHFLVFTTDRGHVTIDWRNDSNGYYDGYVCASVEPPRAAPSKETPAPADLLEEQK